MTVLTFYKKYPFLTLLILSSIIFGGLFFGRKVFFEKKVTQMEHRKLGQTIRFHGNIVIPIHPGDFSKLQKTNSIGTQEGLVNREQIPFMQRIKKLEKVEENYLDGALFIGDSRTSILYEYAKWDQTDFFVKNGLTVWDVNTITLSTVDGTNQTLEQVLKKKNYPKIYIMLGINELGTGNPDSFAGQYQQVIESIRRLQPESLIFLQEILHVTSQKDAEKSYINNQEVNLRNDALRKICDGKQVLYLDINEAFDLAGTKTLDPALSGDGVHIQAKNIQRWKDYLLNHGVLFP
ncbi:MAG: hypothetical protein KA953_02365 [Lachnospiraceae bacterium]|jgi:lysophospholipase L1-like esterase|nr:hypothetical protein [Lachnospiraceae bacterium]